MPRNREYSVRFGVGQHDGRRAAVWRAWVPHPNRQSDVYLAIRHIAGQFKISFHQSGQCHEAWTSEAYGDGSHPRFGQKLRQATRWRRPTDGYSSPLHLYRIAYFDFTITGVPPDDPPEDVVWLERPARRRMRAIDVFCVRSAPADAFVKAVEVGSAAFASWNLANGELLLLTSRELPIDQEALAAYVEFARANEEAVAALEDPTLTRVLVGGVVIGGVRHAFDVSIPFKYPAPAV